MAELPDPHAEPELVEEPVDEEEIPEPEKPEEKMGPGFYLVLALVGFLVIFILVVNVPGIHASAGSTMVQDNWTLVSYADPSGVLVPVLSGTTVTARFGSDGRVFGSAGCNQYSGVFSLKDYAVSVSNVTATEMYCTQAGIMAQETMYLDDLGNVSLFRAGTGYLKLYDGTGKTLLVFGSA